MKNKTVINDGVNTVVATRNDDARKYFVKMNYLYQNDLEVDLTIDPFIAFLPLLTRFINPNV